MMMSRFSGWLSDRIDGGMWSLYDGWMRLMQNNRVQTVLKVWLFVVAVLLAGIVSLKLVSDKYIVSHNVSDSLPQTLFLIDKTASVKKGDYVAFVYHNQGADDPFPEGVYFTKLVVGVEGSKVTSNESRMVFVDNQYVGYAKPTSKLGVPLELIANQTVPAGSLYVMGTHKDSYDSRYARVGLIKSSDIVGKAIPIF